MNNDKTFLAIIPARGGSKRLPRKNILPIAGKPLIAWTIEAASNSEYIDDVFVTSDDDEILGISKKTGVSLIKRPSELANDMATTSNVILHSINSVKKKYDYIILLQPTSPLRSEKHIDEAIILLEDTRADAIISVTENEHSPLWSNTLPRDMNMKNFIRPEIKNTRSQDLPKYYRLNGAIYIASTERFIKEKSMLLETNIYAYEMDSYSSVDIDNKIDFKLAETLITNLES